MTDHSAIWDAVDRLTKPRRQKLDRAPGTDSAWLAEITIWLRKLAAPHEGTCDVPTYRAATAAQKAATQTHALIPSLWDQSTTALHGTEIATDRGNKPLRERTIADLDLMEIRSIIRDTTRRELETRGTRTHGTQGVFNPHEIRALASLITADTKADHAWWQYRFDQWGRLLETYLHAAEHQARPVRLRNAPCPNCRTRQITIDQDGEQVVAPPLIIDFRDGYIRAAECSHCGHTWFRGDQLEELARALGCPDLTGDDTPNGDELASSA